MLGFRSWPAFLKTSGLVACITERACAIDNKVNSAGSSIILLIPQRLSYRGDRHRPFTGFTDPTRRDPSTWHSDPATDSLSVRRTDTQTARIRLTDNLNGIFLSPESTFDGKRLLVGNANLAEVSRSRMP